MRWKEKHGLSDQALVKAVAEMEQGLIDADLGGSVLKKRVALPGRGKRGGVRVIVATQKWIAGSFSSDSRQTNETISVTGN